ncbi:hypothetical protein WDU94_005336 [Cyamophila willieti]
MHTLHIRTAQIYRWWADENPETEVCSLWSQGWCPLLQGIARLCCDTRKDVRSAAITYLQRALLVHDLQTLTGDEWESCFRSVLFPLLAKLLEDINEDDVVGMEEMRMRAATLLSKVFLHHLSPLLLLPTFTHLWLQILDLMDKYMHADGSDLLGEAIPESLKNILLVMDSAKVFSTNDGYSYLWTITWERINQFLPHLKEELFKSHPSVEGFETAAHQSPPSQLPSSEPRVQFPSNVSAGPIPSNVPPTSGQPVFSSQPLTSVFPPQPQGIPTSIPQTGAPASYHPTNIPSSFTQVSEPTSFQPPGVSTSLHQNLPPSSSFQPISSFQPANFYPTEVPAPTPYYPPLSIPNQTSSYPIENALHQSSLGSSQPLHFLPMPVPPSSQYQSSVYSVGMHLAVQAGNAVMEGSEQGIPGLTGYAGTQNCSQMITTSDSELPLSQVSAPHPIINIVTQPQSYSMSGDPGAPPQLTEEVVCPSSAITVPARHAAPSFPQLVSTPMGPPLPLSPSSDSFLSAFVPTPSSNSSHFYSPITPGHNPYTMYPPGGFPNKPVGGAQAATADQENAKNFFYQPIPNSSSETTMTANSAQSMGSPPRSTGILLNPDMSNITANLPSVVAPQDS